MQTTWGTMPLAMVAHAHWSPGTRLDRLAPWWAVSTADLSLVCTLGSAMLSIGKLGRGAEGYYLRSVAAGVEDYYLGSGEATGYRVGAGSTRLGLSGPVQANDLQAMLDGRHPSSHR